MHHGVFVPNSSNYSLSTGAIMMVPRVPELRVNADHSLEEMSGDAPSDFTHYAMITRLWLTQPLTEVDGNRRRPVARRYMQDKSSYDRLFPICTNI